MAAMREAGGVLPHPIASGETLGAIAIGVIDSPTMVILDMGFHEQVQYVTQATYLPLAATVVSDERFFEGLSPDEQAILLRCADETDVWQSRTAGAPQPASFEAGPKSPHLFPCPLTAPPL